MTNFAAVVLAAGRGARMRSHIPKVLHRVCGKPMASIAADAASDAGLDPIVFVTPPDSAPVRSAIGDGCAYVVQEQPMGTGHALLQAQEVSRECEDLLVMNGDIPLITSSTLESLAEAHILSLIHI